MKDCKSCSPTHTFVMQVEKNIQDFFWIFCATFSTCTKHRFDARTKYRSHFMSIRSKLHLCFVQCTI